MFFNISKSCFKDLVLLAGMFTALGTQAQIEHIKISDTLTVDKLYVGFFAHKKFSGEKMSGHYLSSGRLGSRVSFQLVQEKLQFRSFGVVSVNQGADNQLLKSYAIVFTPNKNTVIEMGVMATPTTEIRPNPVTWQSQVETNSESNLPGGNPGLKVRYSLSKNLSLTYGLHSQAAGLAHHLKLMTNFHINNILDMQQI